VSFFFRIANPGRSVAYVLAFTATMTLGCATGSLEGIGSGGADSKPRIDTSSSSASSSGAGTGGAGGASTDAATAASSASGAAGAGGGPASSSAGTGGGPGQPPSDGFDAFQHHNLDVVNQYRATLGVAPLVLDSTLCAFALAGSQELENDHIPHAHFNAASSANTLWQDGFTSKAGENQGDPNGWPALSNDPVENELDQIDSIQKAMFDEGPGPGEAHGHYENMMNPQYTRLGVGLIEVGMLLYLTNDFSD
jgi:uncharacterized protein YkwD